MLDFLSDSSLSELSLSREVLDALAQNGYSTVRDLKDATPEELATELGIDTPAAQQVFMLAFTAAGRVSGSQQHAPLSQTSLPPPSTPISASQLLALPTTLPAHSFQSQAISALIQPAGGVQRGTIVEVSGPPGIGKTAAVVGLSLDARRSEEEVLVIDTEGGLGLARFRTAVHALAQTDASIEPNLILSGIHLIRVHTLTQLVAFFSTLDAYLMNHPAIKLVCIDTLSNLLRSPSLPPDRESRSRILSIVRRTLQRCAAKHKCAFLVTVQFSSKVLDLTPQDPTGPPYYRSSNNNSPSGNHNAANGGSGSIRGPLVLAPQLGDAWHPPKTQRVILFFGGATPLKPGMRRFASVLPPKEATSTGRPPPPGETWRDRLGRGSQARKIEQEQKEPEPEIVGFAISDSGMMRDLEEAEID